MGVEIPPINLETLLIARGGYFFFFSLVLAREIPRDNHRSKWRDEIDD